ncbi:MAG: peroxide stress protein YaaA [Candidatus Endonucleobacter sp. (ex Gigantidas childressi)]|nr:peroxide stress protein YaaA [Candidatus Endonucleobacter sp. (ex Gigantidas childressi)]
MLLVISPAKSLDYETPAKTTECSIPDFMAQSVLLIEELRKKTPVDISSLMSISEKLAQLNTARYQAWSPKCTTKNAKQAVMAFTGDVYLGLDANSLTKAQLDFTQKHLRILSGLYGLLRPLDLMQAYRLEMGTKLKNHRGENLYSFWGDTITNALNKELAKQKSNTLVNLASNEYFKSIHPKKLNAKIITPIFKDRTKDQYKIISFYAKKARGLMCRYVIDNKIEQVEKLTSFDYGGYSYNGDMSSKDQWVYTRDHS